MQSWREQMITGIDKILQRLYTHVLSYNEAAQPILSDFYSTLRKFEDQQNFKEAVHNFDKKYRFSDEYYQYAFLWYSCDLFNLIYKYLTLGKECSDILRTNLKAIFPLLSKQVPLTNSSEWEPLQKTTHRSIIPTLHKIYGDEIQIIHQLNSLIDQRGIGAFNPKHIFDTVRLSIHKRVHRKTFQQLVHFFFDLSQIEWYFFFFPAAFSLSWIFVYLKIFKPKQFKQILLSFSKKEAYVSRSSRIYYGKEEPYESFIGWILIPRGSSHILTFRNYLEIREELGIFKIVEFQEMIDFKYSSSYSFYKAGFGWSFETKQFKDVIRRKYPLKSINEPSPNKFFTTDKWNTNWSCLDSPNKTQMIETYCKFWTFFSYEDLCKLAGKVTRKQDKTKLFKPDNRSLREFLKKNVLQIVIIPQELLLSFTFDTYLVLPPRDVSKEQINRFLSIIPHCFSYELHNGYVRFFCYLDATLVDFIHNNLKWQTLLLIQRIAQPKLRVDFFDHDSNSWKKPWFLQEKKEGKLHI